MESHNALGVEERYHSYLRQTYSRVRLDSSDVSQELELSIALKINNDTAGPNGLTPALLVYCIVPRSLIRPKNFPQQIKRINAMRAAKDELSNLISTGRTKTALARNIPSSADMEIRVADEVLMFREKPVSKWLELYLVNHDDGKMLKLDTGDRLIDASLDKVKKHINQKCVSTTELFSSDTSQSSSPLARQQQDDVSRMIDQFLPRRIAHLTDDAIHADELIVKSIDLNSERSGRPDFFDAMKAEVDGLRCRNLWKTVS